MCGIAGFTAPGRDARQWLDRMLDAIAYRGPDGRGTFIDADLALGHLRLAIIDLAGGAQPRVDRATGDALTFNGEIYGYRKLADELRAAGVPLCDQSDTEVLFQLLRRVGVRKALERIGGMFAFAYRDGRTGALHLVRDRFGEKPLYYGVAGVGVVFGSEAGAVRAHPAFQAAAPDLAAAYQLLQFEYVPGQASGWEGIEKVPPGSILTFDNGRVTVERYWRPRVGGGQRAVPEREAVAQLEDRLRTAVRQQLVSDVPLGVFLSGGIDSSLLTALAAEAAPDITAFTVSVGAQGFDETAYAAEAAASIGVRHEVVRLSERDLLQAFEAVSAHLSEPLADSSLLPTWLVCRAARQSMTVALGGDGADELFAGYPNFMVQRHAWAMRLVPSAAGAAVAAALACAPSNGDYMNWQFLVCQLAQGFGRPVARQSYLWMAPFSEERMETLWTAGAAGETVRKAAFAPVDAAASEAAGTTDLDRLLHQFLVTYLPDDILMKTDRAAMFNSLEVRAPFLDAAVAEYAGALPSELKLRGNRRKYILKQVARKHLPDRLVDRKKHGFAVPIGHLLRTLFRECCRDIILSRANPVALWFDRPALERLLEEHMSGRREHGKGLWALLVLFMVAGRRTAPARHDAAPHALSPVRGI